MKRRNLFKMLAGLACLPAAAAVAETLPKVEETKNWSYVPGPEWAREIEMTCSDPAPDGRFCRGRRTMGEVTLLSSHVVNARLQICERCGKSLEELHNESAAVIMLYRNGDQSVLPPHMDPDAWRVWYPDTK